MSDDWDYTKPISEENYLRALREYIAVLGIGPLDRFDAWLAERDRMMREGAFSMGVQAVEDAEYRIESIANPYTLPEACKYSFSHTRAWCGHVACREA
jgi:hypothetical protein